jgi:hypothetical protein
MRKLYLNGYLNPSFGDFKRLGMDLSAQYWVVKNFSVELALRYLLNSQVASGNKSSDLIAGLTAHFGW